MATVPCNPEVARRRRVRKPDDEQDEMLRTYWPTISRLGRHGYAMSRLSGLLAGGAFIGLWTGVLPMELILHGPRGDSLAWLLTLGVPVLAGTYRVLLGRYDRDAEQFGGGETTLERWRAGLEEQVR